MQYTCTKDLQGKVFSAFVCTASGDVEGVDDPGNVAEVLLTTIVVAVPSTVKEQVVESSSVAIEIVDAVSSGVTVSVETGDKTDSVVVGICDIVVGIKVSV